MARRLLLDTTIFIHYFRGREEARECLDRLADDPDIEVLVSAVTEAELFFGCRNETQELRTAEVWGTFNVLSLTREIMIEAGRIRRSTGGRPRLADMLIAATARLESAALLTHNLKDFQEVPGLLSQKPYDLA